MRDVGEMGMRQMGYLRDEGCRRNGSEANRGFEG